MPSPPLLPRLVRARSIAVPGVVLMLATACHHSRAAAPVQPAEEATPWSEATQSVPSATAEELEGVNAVRVEQLLESRFPGVVVLRTSDGGFSVRIRGTTLRGGQPLYVIDGTPVQLEAGQGLTWIDPAHVQRIDVLKGTAAALYGWRGGNGVILITTKQKPSPKR